MTTTGPRGGRSPFSVATSGCVVALALGVGDPDACGAAACLPLPEHATSEMPAAIATAAAVSRSRTRPDERAGTGALLDELRRASEGRPAVRRHGRGRRRPVPGSGG